MNTTSSPSILILWLNELPPLLEFLQTLPLSIFYYRYFRYILSLVLDKVPSVHILFVFVSPKGLRALLFIEATLIQCFMKNFMQLGDKSKKRNSLVKNHSIKVQVVLALCSLLHYSLFWQPHYHETVPLHSQARSPCQLNKTKLQ